MNPKKKFLWYGTKQFTLSLLCDQKKKKDNINLKRFIII